MIPKRTAHRLSLLTLVIITTMSAATGLRNSIAQDTSNTIRVEAGQTLEIGTDTASTKSEFSWILTKDRKFQSAQRTRFFQTRLAEPGTYVLDVSVQDPVTSENGYRAFTIVVTEPTGSIPSPTGDKTKPLSARINTDPPAVNGVAYVAPDGGMLKIDASASDGNISGYHLDFDTSVDTNGDGNPANDKDNVGTLSEKAGTPVYIFLLPKSAERRVKLSITELAAVEPKTVELPVLFQMSPQNSASSAVSSNPNTPVLMQREGATVRFSAALSESQTGGKEVLYEWDFGDRSKSLLYAPVHTYAAAGTYTVALRIRDIANADVLYEGTETLVIDTIPVTSASSSLGVMSSASSSSATSGGEGNTSLKGILQVTFIIVLLLGFAIGLYLLFTWLKRKTTNSLQKTLEKMEGSIVSKDTPLDAQKPVVMKLKKETLKPAESAAQPDIIIDREKSQQEFSTQERTVETPAATAGPVPGWLAKASTKPVAAPVTPVSPAPATPAPASKETAAPLPDAPVPAWLKPAPAPTAAPAETAKAAPPTPPTSPTAPQKAPTPPAPVPKPTPPVPVAERPAPVSTPTAQAPKPSEPQPKPENAPAPAKVPAPMPAPILTPEPKATVSAPAPKTTASAKTVIKPVTQSEPAPLRNSIPVPEPIPPAEPKPDDEDPLVAIIQADSISK